MSAAGNPSYQWYFGATLLVGKTTNSLTVANVDYSVTGPYQVVVTNTCGSVTSYLAWLSISDTNPPTLLTWPSNQTNAANAACQAQVPDLTSLVTASDNCGAVTFWQVPEAGTWVGLGPTVVTVSVYDQAGNVTNRSVTLTVVDVTPPTITCSSNITTTCTSTNGAQVSFAPVVSDNCDLSPTVNCQPPSGSFFPEGTTTVVCTATDASGNSNSCSFTVKVLDPIPAILAIARQTPNVLISWPQTCSRFVLEETVSLRPIPQWSTNSAAWSICGTNYCVTVWAQALPVLPGCGNPPGRDQRPTANGIDSSESPPNVHRLTARGVAQ